MDNTMQEQYPPEWTEHVKKLGRVFIYNRVLWLSWSGTGIEWECEGGFRLRIQSDAIPFGQIEAETHKARYALFMDGNPMIDECLDEKTRVIYYGCEGKHRYRFVKLSESADSSLGIVSLEDGDGGVCGLIPTAEKKLKIEIVGDSITCGYGVEGSIDQTYTTATENVSKSYSYSVPEYFNADYSIVSKSGAGIISGYTDSGIKNTENILTDYYDRMGCSMFGIGEVWPSDFEYDFSFEPDIIILNAGTNDCSYCSPEEPVRSRFSEQELEERQREFCAEYKTFLTVLRRRNPFAKIVCTLGIMNEKLNRIVEMAVNMQIAEGDRRVYWLPLRDQDPADGYGTDYHPSEKTQVKLASTVIDFIEKNL